MNKGIIVKGNSTFFGHNIAVGDNATIKNSAVDSDSKNEIIKKLDELNKMIMNYRDDLDNKMELIEDVILVKEEIKKDKPNKSKIDARISKLDSSISSVANIASALKTIKAAISCLL